MKIEMFLNYEPHEPPSLDSRKYKNNDYLTDYNTYKDFNRMFNFVFQDSTIWISNKIKCNEKRFEKWFGKNSNKG
jgi:hypothetical protein